jgi:hypothetical protein
MTLRQGAARDGTTLRIVADDGRRAMLAAATQTAEQTARSDGALVRELTRWSPAPGSAYHDGVPATAYPAQDESTTPYFPQPRLRARPGLGPSPAEPGQIGPDDRRGGGAHHRRVRHGRGTAQPAARAALP